MSLLNIFGANLAIDLGTANTLVYKEKEGIIINEASAVAFDTRTAEVVAIGNAAYDMYGKSPENVMILRPLENGKISNFEVTKILFKYCIDKAIEGFTLFQPKVVITAPSGISDIELRALEDACTYSGARDVYIVESTLASAIGSDIDISKKEGRLIVDFGAGSTEISIISMNGIVISKNIKYGGDYVDQEIIDYIYDKHSLIIGKTTAKEAKESIGAIGDITTFSEKEISGRDVMTGMPLSIIINSSDIIEAINDTYKSILDGIRYVLEKNPPELSKDILKNGIFITGGGSRLKNLDIYIEKELGLKLVKSKNPFSDAINGAGTIVTNLEEYKKIGK
ncbi:rod shape-determining protein [Helcococcus ovis]|uniref:rod shape-determining protein n=1 Tax=Helcococcus ovis TaxID=72026 RepID=UPI0038BBC822